MFPSLNHIDVSRETVLLQLDKVFKNGPNKIYGKQPLNNFKGYGWADHPIKFFKDCLPQILLGPILNICPNSSLQFSAFCESVLEIAEQWLFENEPISFWCPSIFYENLILPNTTFYLVQNSRRAKIIFWKFRSVLLIIFWFLWNVRKSDLHSSSNQEIWWLIFNPFSTNVPLTDKPDSWFLLAKCLKNTCGRVTF